MPVVGIIHSAKSKMVRRIVSTDAHHTLPDHVGPGEALYVMDISGDNLDNNHIAALHDRFYDAMGFTPESKPNPRCALVDPSGTVINMIMADPEIDKHPDGHVISAHDDITIGDKWDGKKFLLRHARHVDGVVTDFIWSHKIDTNDLSLIRDHHSKIGDKLVVAPVSVETEGTEEI